jgi:transglutaminase-like putative cysteine protease
VSVRGVRVYKGELNDLGNRLIGDQGWFESSGMSSQPRLGSTFDLRGSPERVLRVRDLGDDAHLRGASFDTYEGGRWGPSAAPGQRQYRKVTLNELSLPAQGGLSVTASVRGRQDMVITRLVSDNRLVFAPLGAVSLDPGEADDVEWSPENGGPIRTRARPPYEYTVTVGSDERYQGPQATPIVPRSGKARDRLLQMPDNPDMGYIRTLSAEIVRRAGARTSEAKAEAVVRYLLANHQYSLSTQVGPGDPVASFLRDKKSAHCEFFAASAALLLRAAGVPTRYVQGYYAHEAAGEGVTIVRQRDAHAWTEVWLDGVGWVWIDATPGDGRPDNDPERIAPWRRASEWLQDHIQGLRDLLADLPPEVLNAIVAVIALLPLGYFVLRTQLAKRRRRGDAGESSGDYTAPPGDLPEAAARFEAALARAGAPAPAERTWAEHLGNVPAALAEAAAPFVRAYDAARFGGRYDAETAARLGRLLDGVERAAVPADNAQRGDSKTTA